MSMYLRSSKSALGPGLQASFLAGGGEEPYIYTLHSGARGTINSSTGLYTAPSTVSEDPALTLETVRATANNGEYVTLPILVTDPLGLFCEIMQKELGLASGQVYLWDQKINQPKNSDLYIAVALMSAKPFGNTNRPVSAGDDAGLDSHQSVNMLATLQVSVISRGPQARTRKEEIILAWNSDYAQAQQEANSFYIGKLPPGSQFVNLSSIDGAAIPYRFDISVNLQYFYKKVKPVSYMDEFATVQVTTES